MAAELTPTSYINHHLTNMTTTVGDGSFWTLHLDTLVMSVMLGIMGMGFLWLIVRRRRRVCPVKRKLLLSYWSSLLIIRLKILSTEIDMYL